MTPTHVWLNARRPDLQAEFDGVYRRVGTFAWALDGKAPPAAERHLPIHLTELPVNAPTAAAHRTSWQRAFDAVRSLTVAVASAAAAGFLAETDPTVVRRRASCAACPIRRDVGGRSYCNGCACPQSPLWPVAELDLKLRFPELECPRRQPGFSNHVPAPTPGGSTGPSG